MILEIASEGFGDDAGGAHRAVVGAGDDRRGGGREFLEREAGLPAADGHAGHAGEGHAVASAPRKGPAGRPRACSSLASQISGARPMPPPTSQASLRSAGIANGRPSGPSKLTGSPGRSRESQRVPVPTARCRMSSSQRRPSRRGRRCERAANKYALRPAQLVGFVQRTCTN